MEPDDSKRFEYPFSSNFFDVDGVRIHYVDEGSGQPVLLVHGQPTWSYLYRKVIPPLVAAGFRCIAPDLMGFGLSDKPTKESAYTVQRHVAMLSFLVQHLNLRSVTVVCHDWGGPIGLRFAIDHQDAIAGLVILNTMAKPLPIPWWFRLLFRSPGLSTFLVRRLDLLRRVAFAPKILFKRRLDPRAREQYFLPHNTSMQRAGVAAFPKLIPSNTAHPTYTYVSDIESTLKTWDVPVLVMFSDRDPVFKPRDGQHLADVVPNGRFYLVKGAGHYLQEDAADEVAEQIKKFLEAQAGQKDIER